MTKTLGRAAGLALASACLACAAMAAPKPAPAAAKPAADALDPAVMKVQVVLDRLGFSPGVIDGRRGQSLTEAIKGFQAARGLKTTGSLDAPTLDQLRAYDQTPATRELALTAEAIAGPFVDPMPKDPAEQAKLPALGYRSKLEKLAEMFHTTPKVLVELNSPTTRLAVGSKVTFPNVVPEARDYDAKLPEAWRQTLSGLNVDSNQPQAAKVVVDKSDGVLRAYDAAGKLVAQFPATMGSSHDPLPIGTWKIQGASYNPTFNYNPALFWDADKSEKKQRLPAGPNGPVGVIWLDLNKPHYGIHGTPSPETIGRAESHGCIRLSNWDAARLSLMVKPGTPAVFQN